MRGPTETGICVVEDERRAERFPGSAVDCGRLKFFFGWVGVDESYRWAYEYVGQDDKLFLKLGLR
jgi:hypothetical protein